MQRSKGWLVAAVAALATGCGPSHSVPVSVSHCTIERDAGGATLRARVRNDAEKPIGQVEIRADLYRDFRFVRVSVAPAFSPVLDPGTTREIVEPVDVAGGVRGAASHCAAESIVYGDGTTDRAP